MTEIECQAAEVGYLDCACLGCRSKVARVDRYTGMVEVDIRAADIRVSEGRREAFLSYCLHRERSGFDGAFPALEYPRATGDALVTEGLVRERWMAVRYSDGRIIMPRREHKGYALTDAGRRLARKLEVNRDQ